MSQIRKSASFRSRIPIRRAKPVPRRCYSPEPYRQRSSSSMYDHHEIIGDAKQQSYLDQRISKQRMKRQRHVATTIQAQHIPNPMGNDATMMSTTPKISARPKTIYSSSSYSSSDESQVSESPPQVHKFQYNFRLNWVEFQYAYQNLISCLAFFHRVFN